VSRVFQFLAVWYYGDQHFPNPYLIDRRTLTVLKRNNIKVRGDHPNAMVFAHGFGCDQNMWRFVAPAFEDNFKTVQFDNVGAGKSDLSAYSFEKYGTLHGYADDLIEIVAELNLDKPVFIGHSVSAMVGLLAQKKSPGLFGSLVLVGPSPCYINDGSYVGGFTRAQLEELIETLEENHLGWSASMAPVIMANAERPELGEELSASFCRTDPDIAAHFARVTFMSDHRSDVGPTSVPTLILQCSNDVIAPNAVGVYMRNQIPGSTLVEMKATGHCPNLSAPEETVDAIRDFLSP
jgi:sigma-B regulation protein RsbQ